MTYTFYCTCADGSYVEYRLEGGVKMVYQTFIDGTKRKAEYERGKWIKI